MITHRYDYTPIERIDHPSGRRYQVNGLALPSVTTILSKTKDMTYLNEWRNAVGDAEATRIVTEASNLGSGMHNLLEDYVLGRPMKGQFMSKTLANLIIKQGLSKVTEMWGTEVALYSANLYAGTTDLVGKMINNRPAIIDFKNSRNPKTEKDIDDYKAQLAAYALAHNEMYGTDIDQGVIMMATRCGKYQEFWFEGDKFRECIDLWLTRLVTYYELPAALR